LEKQLENAELETDYEIFPFASTGFIFQMLE